MSIVPAPHIRLPDPVVDESTTVENAERITSSGQAEGFDFRTFSGVQQPPPAPLRAHQPPARPSPTEASPSVQPEAASPAAQPQSRRFYLELNSPVVDAPSIGPKTADRLISIGINTVADLLRVDPQQAAIQLGNPAAHAVIREWQAQATLVCRIPNLRGHDAQFLVACRVLTPEQLRGCEPRKLLEQVMAFVNTTAGQRLLRGGTAPDLAEVTEWIIAARDARSLA